MALLGQHVHHVPAIRPVAPATAIFFVIVHSSVFLRVLPRSQRGRTSPLECDIAGGMRNPHRAGPGADRAGYRVAVRSYRVTPSTSIAV